MRIAFVTGKFPKLSETFVINQITGLLDRGHDVQIFASETEPEAKVHPAVSNYGLLERTQYWPADLRDKARTLGKGALKRVASKGLAAFKTLGFPEYGEFDVIYCHFGHVGEHARRLREGGVFSGPLVVVFHAWDVTVLLNQEPAGYYDTLFEQAELLLPISHLWKGRLKDLGAPQERIKVHRMGIDVETFEYRERAVSAPVRIVSVARLVEKKGIRYALEALGDLRARRPNLSFEYNIAGDGPLRSELEKAVQERDLVDHVKFHGWLQQDEIAALLDDSEILLTPSVTAKDGDMEGIPVVLMEGMARGLAVVTTRHSGIPELVEHQESGLLVDERDSKGLSEALESLFDAEARMAELGRAARARVEQEFEIRKLNDRLEKLLEEIAD